MKWLDRLSALPRPAVWISGIMLVFMIGLADRMTGPAITFSIFYLLPIGFVAWVCGPVYGILCVAFSVALRIWVDLTWWPKLSPFIHAWNATGRLGAFTSIVLLLSYAKTQYARGMQRAQEKYIDVIEAAIEGVIATDPSLTIGFVNGRAATYLGWRPEDLIGRNLVDLVPDGVSQTIVQRLSHAADPVRTMPSEVAFMRRDGSTLWFLVSISVYCEHEDAEPELVFLLTDISEQKKAEETSRSREQQLRKLSIELQRVQEDERRKFARELHDGLSQVLTTLKVMCELALKSHKTDPEATEEHLNEVLSLAGEAHAEAKQIAHGLRPSVLDDFGLTAAIPMLVSRVEKRTGIAFDVHLPSNDVRFDSLVETNIYRIVQELLANTVQHSGATRVDIQLLERNGTLALSVADNGKGLQSAPANNGGSYEDHAGLRNLRERVEMLGGTFRIESQEGHGAEFQIELPAGLISPNNPPVTA